MGEFNRGGGFKPRGGSRDGPREGGFRPRGGGFGGGFRGPRPPQEKHKAVCSDCNQECEVPFEPKEGRPVYCKDCWAKRRDQAA